jgi:glycosyltransferase involved in cell wall biosynthesis
MFLVKLFTGLRDVLRRERVALVHAHLPDVIIWAASVGFLTRTPVIGTYHGLGIWPRNRNRLDVRNTLRRVLYRFAGWLCDRTIAVSPTVRTMLCDDLGFDERKTVVLLNGIDTGRFGAVPIDNAPRTALDLQARSIIICVGRLVAGKGQHLLIKAMPGVLSRHPNAALLLVGDGPERASLEHLVLELRLTAAVRLAGERMDVPDLLAISSIFVLPSFSEGISLALIEAMAAGTPVIATAIPGNRDVVVDDRYGVLVPPGDVDAIADAICALFDDPARTAAMAARGQERVKTHFDISASLAATASLYAEVLSERRGAAAAGGAG